MSNMTKDFRLSIELVPSTAWGQNLRKLMKPFMWHSIRNEVLEKAKGTCMICKANGTLDCHEVWIYDDESHIQKLAGFLALCKDCHDLKHIGFASLSHGKPKYEKLVNHFMKVNNCSRADFVDHYNTAMNLFNERSKYDWEMDISMT